MPIPRPGETKDKFISRCMAHPDLLKKPQDQRAGECYGIWNQHHKGKDLGIFNDSYSYQVKGTDHYGFTANVKSVDVDVKKMCARAIFVTDSLDRQGDVFNIAGIKTDYHRLSPLVLFNHGKEFPLAIGRTVDPDGNYTVVLDEHEGWQTTYFFPTLEGEQFFALVEMGALNCNSIGYRPLAAKRLSRGPNQLQKPGLYIDESELLEASWVTLAANGECLRAALSKELICGKSLAPSLKSAFEPALRQILSVSKLTVGTKMGQDKKLPDETTKGKMDPAEVAAEASAGHDPEGKPMKHGAAFAHEMHGYLKAFLESAKDGVEMVENKSLVKAMHKAFGHARKAADTIGECYKAEYPDHEALPEIDIEIAEGDQSDTPDEEEGKGGKSQGKAYDFSSDPDFAALAPAKQRELILDLRTKELKRAHLKRLESQPKR